MANLLAKTNIKSKSALAGYIGAAIMAAGFISELPNRDSQSDIFKAINLAGATCAICLAGICRNTKKD
jgi:hypothetical protein